MKFDSSYLWSPRYATWIIITLLAGLGLLILSKIVSVFTFRNSINTIPTQVSAPLVVKKEKIAEALDTELFGIYIPPQEQSAEIKPSTLNLVLIGIMHSSNPDDSLAIIKGSNGQEEGYQEGDSIENEVVLESIHPEWVIVNHNGALERLALPQDELIFEPLPEPMTED